MTRTITTAVQTEFDADVLRPFYAVELAFDSGTSRIWSGYGDITFGGNTYSGVGTLGAISRIEETQEIASTGVRFGLSGIPSDILSVALSEPYQGRSAKIYLGVFDANYGVIADPFLCFDGRMDVMAINDDGDTSTITVTAEHRLIDLERPRLRRYTSEDQKALYSGDKGFDFVADLQDKTIAWGSGDSTYDLRPPASVSAGYPKGPFA